MRVPGHYRVDPDRQESDAWLEDDALLYRIATNNHWERRFIISGDGSVKNSSVGRFHRADQRASYCANNIIVCLSEMLYHMYRMFLDQLRDSAPKEHSERWTTKDLRFVIFAVKRIDKLVYADSIGAKSYDAGITSSTVVFPDPYYGPLHKMADKARQEKKNGVVYPSARHSEDFAFALFKNETKKLMEEPYVGLSIILRLIAEDQDTTSFPPNKFKVHTDKLHATMGYYQFKDEDHLEALKAEGLIHPKNIPARGYVDFVRRRYTEYPRRAVCP